MFIKFEFARSMIYDHLLREDNYSNARENAFRLLIRPDTGYAAKLEPISEVHAVETEIWDRKERPSLYWYATVLTMYAFEMEMTSQLLIRLMTAACYYGDADLVLGAAKRILSFPKISDEVEYEAIKQEAKAFKISGKYSEARDSYRKAIKLLVNRKDECRLAYFLTLFAKLCNDYQQKQGWHLAFHKISLDRLEKIIALSTEKSYGQSRHRRWLQICKDSFAKAVYLESPQIGERLFEEVLSDVLCEEIRIRVVLRRLNARILSYIEPVDPRMASPEVRAVIQQDLITFREYLEKSLASGNIRASAVRTVQFIRLSRMFAEWERKSFGQVSTPFLKGLIAGQAIYEAKHSRMTSLAISDMKNAALAGIECASWILMRSDNSGRLDQNSALSALEELDQSKRILAALPEYSYDLFHEILKIQGLLYSSIGNWRAATASYQEAYDLSDSAIGAVESDNAEIRQALEIPEIDRAKANLEAVELCALSDNELVTVRDRLGIDYRLLLTRMKELGSRLHASHARNISETIHNQIQLSTSFRYHDVAQHIRRARSKSSLVDVFAELDQLSSQLDGWQEESRLRWNVREMDLAAVLHRALTSAQKTTTWQYLIDATRLSKRRVPIRFDEMLIMPLVDILITNCADAAQRVGKTKSHIYFDLRIADNIAWLEVGDDIDAVDNLELAVNSLNAGHASVQSESGERGGRGLILVRRLLKEIGKVGKPWRIERYELPSIYRKCLIIPFAFVIDETSAP